LNPQNPLTDLASALLLVLAHALLLEMVHAGWLACFSHVVSGLSDRTHAYETRRCSTDAYSCEESCPLLRTLHRPLTRRLLNPLFIFVRAINVGR
jgi:hypothetical protein